MKNAQHVPFLVKCLGNIINIEKPEGQDNISTQQST